MVIASVSLLWFAACSDDVSTSGTDSLPDPALGEIVTEQNLDAVRSQFEAGAQTWDQASPTDYRLDVDMGNVASVSIDFVAGSPVAETVAPLNGDFFDPDLLPRTIDDVFDEIERTLSALEDDPSQVPELGECGFHLNVSFDAALGYPTYYDSLGPCDDGVGISVKVTVD